jgi:hypothetical protein
MAVSLDVTNTPLGVGFQNAYARIATVVISRQLGGGHRVMIDVAIYATIPDDNTQNVDLRRYVVPAAELVGDVIPAAYEMLKQHPDFAGASDA